MRAMRTLCVAGVMALVACGGKGDAPSSPSESAAAPSAATPAAGPAATWQKMTLTELGVSVMAPGDAKPSALGGVSALGGKCNVMINKVSQMSPSFENEVGNIEKGHKGGPLKAFAKKDKKDDDNWAIEWTTDKRFGYSSRQKVGDTAYSCGRVSADADGHACVMKVCESLATP